MSLQNSCFSRSRFVVMNRKHSLIKTETYLMIIVIVGNFTLSKFSYYAALLTQFVCLSIYLLIRFRLMFTGSIPATQFLLLILLNISNSIK